MSADPAWGVLLSPMILFFILGGIAGFLRSDLSIPESIAKAMSLYLMAAIGLKGGIEVSQAGLTAEFVTALVAGVALSLLLPVPAFLLLRRLGRLDRVNAAAVAAHYGSVSVVTFVTGSEVLASLDIRYDGYMVAVMAAMETPAIVAGLLLAGSAFRNRVQGPGHSLWHETLLNGAVVLLLGSFAIGLLVGEPGAQPVMPFFETGFRGVLCLFLLDMGLIASRRLRENRSLDARLISIGIALPLLQGCLGVMLGSVLGLSPGSAALLGILAGSASYIAVPAAMRMSLPQADPGVSLGMALAITFPFNVTMGIPVYISLAVGMGT